MEITVAGPSIVTEDEYDMTDAKVFLLVAAALVAWPNTSWARPRPAAADGAALLSDLCEAHAGEPVCVARQTLTPDEAWAVMDHACRSKPAAEHVACNKFRTGNGPVLRHNLRTGAWTAEWDWGKYGLEFDVAGVPTMRLKASDARPLKILVSEVSPLTYSATPGVPKEDDLPVMAGLKTVLALAGTGIQAAIQTLTYSAIEPAPSQLDLDWLLKDSTTLKQMKGVGKPGTPAPPAPPPPPPCIIAGPNVVPAAEYSSARKQTLAELAAKTTALHAQVDDLAKKRAAFIESAQTAEDGGAVVVSALTVPNTAQLLQAFDDFERAATALSAKTAPLTSCMAFLDAYGLLLGAPPDAAVIRALAGRVASQSDCGDYTTKALIDSLRDNARALADPVLADADVCSAGDVKKAIELHRDATKPFVDRLTGWEKNEEKVWAAIDKARESRAEVLAGARLLGAEVEDAKRHTWAGVLVRQLVVTRQNPKLPWNKVQTHEVVLKADSPYVKQIALAKGGEERRAYKLESATNHLLGYGVGVVFTPLQEPTFGAVARPGSTDKVIAKTSQEPRAGALAGFVTVRPFSSYRNTRRTQLTFDLGVGLNADHPAFFIGPSLEFGRIARLGVGWALQRTTRLAGGQREDVTVVASVDDIRTEKYFNKDRLYVTFSLAFDGLSLFNAK